MPAPLVIRAATLDDLPALAALNLEVQHHHVIGEPDKYRDVDLDTAIATLRDRLSTHEALLAERDGVAVGYAVFLESRVEGNPYGHDHHVVKVDQIGASTRRAGVGRALMEAVHALAEERGANAVALDVRAFNQGAIAFYEALGYHPVQLRMLRPVDPR